MPPIPEMPNTPPVVQSPTPTTNTERTLDIGSNATGAFDFWTFARYMFIPLLILGILYTIGVLSFLQTFFSTLSNSLSNINLHAPTLPQAPSM